MKAQISGLGFGNSGCFAIAAGAAKSEVPSMAATAIARNVFIGPIPYLLTSQSPRKSLGTPSRTSFQLGSCQVQPTQPTLQELWCRARRQRRMHEMFSCFPPLIWLGIPEPTGNRVPLSKANGLALGNTALGAIIFAVCADVTLGRQMFQPWRRHDHR